MILDKHIVKMEKKKLN